MQCPSCSFAPMQAMQYEGVTVENCPQCGGYWLDKAELNIINTVREKKFDPETCRAIADQTGVQGVKLENVDRDLVCPKCGATTDPVNFGGNTGIILDRCTGCGGFWLDKGELANVQQLVEGWEAQLPGDLMNYGGKLSRVRDEIHANLDEADDISRLPLVGGFINMMIGGVLNLGR